MKIDAATIADCLAGHGTVAGLRADLYNVRVDIGVPGPDIIVGHEHRRDHAHEDVYVATRDAFHAARRRLEDFVRRKRGDVKSHAVPLHGRVVELRPDYGLRKARDVRRAPGVLSSQPYRALRANSVCERVLGALRRECPDFLIPLSDRHLRRTVKSWVAHYNRNGIG